MLGWRTHDFAGCKGAMSLPPIEFDDIAHAAFFQPSLVAQRGDDQRAVFPREPAQRGQIEVVIVIVTDQDEVDRRELGE